MGGCIRLSLVNIILFVGTKYCFFGTYGGEPLISLNGPSTMKCCYKNLVVRGFLALSSLGIREMFRSIFLYLCPEKAKLECAGHPCASCFFF